MIVCRPIGLRCSLGAFKGHTIKKHKLYKNISSGGRQQRARWRSAAKKIAVDDEGVGCGEGVPLRANTMRGCLLKWYKSSATAEHKLRLAENRSGRQIQ